MTGSRPTIPTAARPTTRRARAALAGCLLVALACAALAAAPAARGASTTTLTLEGRGWGHGIGMSQYGADGYAQHGWKYGAIIKHYYTGVTLGKVGNVWIRVLLRSGATSFAVTDAAKFNALWGTKTVHLGAGTTATVKWTGSSYRLSDGSRTWTAGAPITFTPTTSKLKLLTANDNGVVGHYRGRLRVIHLTDGLEIVNTVRLESYLPGVVPRESPASWPIEALKAQAVAARSYAYRATGRSGTFDVYCTTASQMYGGADAETTATNAAVSATRGIVPKYKGTPIVAYFFSTSGGHTENIENVWSAAAPVPYLKGVPDPYDSLSPYDKWPDNPIVRSPASIASALGFTQGPLRDIAVVKRGSSPRVVKALLIGDKGWSLTDGATLRARLGLRDTWLYVASLSITSPVATVTYGGTATITGRLYPVIGSGRKVTLLGRPAGGSWAASAVTATAGSSVVDGYIVKYSTLSARITPTANGRYYFSATTVMHNKASSAQVVVSVRPAVTLTAGTAAAKVGDTVSFSGTIKPAAAATAAASVWLETMAQGATTWTKAVQVTPSADGTYQASWKPTQAGTYSIRLVVGKSSRFVAGTSPSPNPTVTVSAS